MKFVDIHSHLSFPEYDIDRQEVLVRMEENEVLAITVGTDLEKSKKAVEVAESNERVWATIGMHPGLCQNPNVSFDNKEFSELVKSPKVVAIGECGLEYFHLAKDTIDLQKKLFEDQIEFALENNKPLMLHCRESYDDALDILENYKKEAEEKLRGNSHFFAGDLNQAKRFLDIGFTMSFTGVITFTHDYDEVIKYLPIDSIMSETDAPFVAPVPFRGKRNEPIYVIEVVKKMAEIRRQNIDFLNNSIIENFKRVFEIKGL